MTERLLWEQCCANARVESDGVGLTAYCPIHAAPMRRLHSRVLLVEDFRDVEDAACRWIVGECGIDLTPEDRDDLTRLLRAAVGKEGE